MGYTRRIVGVAERHSNHGRQPRMAAMGTTTSIDCAGWFDYARDPFDGERCEQVQEIAAEIRATVRGCLRAEAEYATFSRTHEGSYRKIST